MIGRLIRWVLNVHYPYNNRLDQIRAVGMVRVLAISLIVWTFLLVVSSLPAAPGTSVQETLQVSNLPLNVLFTPVGIIIIVTLVQTGQLRVASWLLILFLMGAIINTLVTSDGLRDQRVFVYLLIMLLSASGLLNRRGILAVFVATLLLLLMGAILLAENLAAAPINITVGIDIFLPFAALVVGTMLVLNLQVPIRETIDEVQEEAQTLERISQFAIQMDQSATEEDAAVALMVFLRGELKYHFAQVFFTGGKGIISRRVRTVLGIRTTSDIEENIRLPDVNIVNEAATTYRVVVANRDDALLRVGHFLPSTLHGIALPVQGGDALIGVLDVQSNRRDTFSKGELTFLNLLAQHFASTVAMLRIIQALRNNLRQQEVLTAQLRQRQGDYRPATMGTWNQYLDQRGQYIFGFDIGSTVGTFVPANDLPEVLRPVLVDGATQVQTQGDTKVVNIPINLRGEILGAMSFTVSKDKPLTDRQIETAQIIASRLALALENRRLIEQTQALAVRERKANEAANLLLSVTDVESVIRLAADSFRDTLGAINTRIHLQPTVLAERSAEPQ